MAAFIKQTNLVKLTECQRLSGHISLLFCNVKHSLKTEIRSFWWEDTKTNLVSLINPSLASPIRGNCNLAILWHHPVYNISGGSREYIKGCASRISVYEAHGKILRPCHNCVTMPTKRPWTIRINKWMFLLGFCCARYRYSIIRLCFLAEGGGCYCWLLSSSCLTTWRGGGVLEHPKHCPWTLATADQPTVHVTAHRHHSQLKGCWYWYFASICVCIHVKMLWWAIGNAEMLGEKTNVINRGKGMQAIWIVTSSSKPQLLPSRHTTQKPHQNTHTTI